jgi:hypothetical protein
MIAMNWPPKNTMKKCGKAPLRCPFWNASSFSGKISYINEVLYMAFKEKGAIP